MAPDSVAIPTHSVAVRFPNIFLPNLGFDLQAGFASLDRNRSVKGQVVFMVVRSLFWKWFDVWPSTTIVRQQQKQTAVEEAARRRGRHGHVEAIGRCVG